MEQEILPIGSIVTLKNEDKKVLIVGLYSVVYDNSIIVYDYQGCSYPEGLTLSDKIYSFNQDDIEMVVHRGYEDIDFINLRNRLVDGPYEETEDDYIMDFVMDNNEGIPENDIDDIMGMADELLSADTEDDKEKKDNSDDLEILVFD